MRLQLVEEKPEKFNGIVQARDVVMKFPVDCTLSFFLVFSVFVCFRICQNSVFSYFVNFISTVLFLKANLSAWSQSF